MCLRFQGLRLLCCVALGLTACGGPSRQAHRLARPATPAMPMQVLVLDPKGRIYDTEGSLRVLCQDEDSGVTQVAYPDMLSEGPAPRYTFTHVPKRGKLIVAARGCRTTYAKAKAGPMTVRLVAGTPINLEIEATGQLPARLATPRVTLTRQEMLAPGRRPVDRQSLAAAWFEEDAPQSGGGTPVSMPDGKVRLYVPGPGSYDVIWHVRRGKTGTTLRARTKIEVGDGDRDRTYRLKIQASSLGARPHAAQGGAR